MLSFTTTAISCLSCELNCLLVFDIVLFLPPRWCLHGSIQIYGWGCDELPDGWIQLLIGGDWGVPPHLYLVHDRLLSEDQRSLHQGSTDLQGNRLVHLQLTWFASLSSCHNMERRKMTASSHKPIAMIVFF